MDKNYDSSEISRVDTSGFRYFDANTSWEGWMSWVSLTEFFYGCIKILEREITDELIGYMHYRFGAVIEEAEVEDALEFIFAKKDGRA